MSVKLVLPAYSRYGLLVAGVEGKLRLVERPKVICHGWANGCACGKCSVRARRKEKARQRALTKPKRCECDRPIGVAGGECHKCGKRLERRAA